MVLTRRVPELRELHRATMCGLCHHVGAAHGLRWRLFAGPDLVTYQVFLDVCAGATPEVERRACVVAPGVSSLPSALPTERTRLAAAVGLWLGALKLDDDRRDEGTAKARLAAAWLGGRAAAVEAELRGRGFPVDEVLGWMERQAVLEGDRDATLEQAVVPTAAISAAVFGFAGVEGGPVSPALARALGEQLGTWLFWTDALEDWEGDAASGRYNPLQVVFGAPGDGAAASTGRAVAVAGARRAIGRLDELLRDLPDGVGARYLREVLVQGFSTRLARIQEGATPPGLWQRVWWTWLVRLPRLTALALRAVPVLLTLVGRRAEAARLLPVGGLPPGGAFVWLCDPCGDCSNDGDCDGWDVCCSSDDCALACDDGVDCGGGGTTTSTTTGDDGLCESSPPGHSGDTATFEPDHTGGTSPPDTGTTPPDTGTTPPDTGTTPPDTGATSGGHSGHSGTSAPDTGGVTGETGASPVATGDTGDTAP